MDSGLSERFVPSDHFHGEFGGTNLRTPPAEGLAEGAGQYGGDGGEGDRDQHRSGVFLAERLAYIDALGYGALGRSGCSTPETQRYAFLSASLPSVVRKHRPTGCG